MTVLPGWTCVSLLITLLFTCNAFAQKCNCGTQYDGYCVTCNNGCYLYYGQCYQCIYRCVSCVDNHICTSCTKGYYGTSCQSTCWNCKYNTCDKNDGHCTNGCVDGYYANMGWGGCSQCSTRCRTCSSQTECTACKQGYYGTSCQSTCLNCKYNTCHKYNGHCTDGCADGYYANMGLGGCSQCSTRCRTCSSQTECTACKQGYYGTSCQSTCLNCKYNTCHKYNGHCTDGCADGYYANMGLGGCSQCSTRCRTCSSQTECTACKQGYYGTSCTDTCSYCKDNTCDKNDGHCTNGCVDGYYPNVGWGGCSQCSTRCRTCSSQTECTTCIQGYYGTSCPDTCSYCKDNTCDKNDGQCTNGCVDGYYPNVGWGGCSQCSKQCITCNSLTDCTACIQGYYGTSCSSECSNCKSNTCHKSNGYCTNGCVDGYYLPQRQIVCVPCPRQCDKCYSDTNCISCIAGYYGSSCGSKCDPNCLNGFCNSINGVCTNGCEYGYYLNGTQCLQNCQVDFCQTCTSDNQVCSVCQDGYYIFNGKCSLCSGRCFDAKCDNVDGNCSEGCKYGFTNHNCTDQCYPNCIACEQYDKETCKSCKPGYHGQKCEYDCNTQCKEVEGVRSCAKTSGACTHGCENGYTGSICSDRCSLNCLSCAQNDQRSCDKCVPDFYGQACDEECSSNCGEVNITKPCYKDTGECLVNCIQGYRGPKCDISCKDGCQDGCDRDTGTCDGCKTLYYGPSCEHKCNSTCYNPNNGSRVCDKQTGNCSFECSHSQCGVKSGQESVGGSHNNGTIIGAATGSVIVALLVVVLVIVFIMMRRKRKKTSNPEPDDTTGNIDAVYSVPDKNRSSKKVESTALYAIPDKSTSVQPNSSTPAIYENGVYSNVDEIQRLPTIGTVYANEDCLEEIDQDGIDNGTLTDVEGPKMDNYYNIYGLTRSRIELYKLNNYLSSKTAEAYEKEFKKLPEGLNRPYDVAVSPKNATKNRYKGIYPYDATRVKLEGNGGDYINASYIEGFGEIEKTYIASLGPIKRSMKGYVDFWRMVWQENVDKIVMLTNFVEGTKEKCDKYWPEIGQTETYGHVKVECINVEVFADFNVSKLNVSTASNSKTTTIHHFHFTAWPDRGTPSNVVSLVEFRESVERVKSTTKGPTVVHCSAGIGRTGTYIALDILTREGQTEGYVDIFGCVLSLRGQRVGMVQNVDQYRYLHHAIEHSLTTNCEQIENGNFCRVSADQIDEGFHLLKNRKDYKDEEETKAIEKNKKEKHKNRKGADIPGDVGRPKLSNHHKGAQSQYINAVYVDSYKQRSKYLLAQTPLSTTVEDFLELVLQENCSCIISLDDNKHTRKQDIGLYVPADDKELSFGNFKVKVTNSESTPEYELRYITIDVQGTGADESKTIPHYQFTDWPANSLVPASVDSFLNLIQDTERTIRDSGNGKGPVLVHCLTGAERCGLIPVVNNLIEKLGVEQQASVVNVARQIRARRARSIPNKEQFQFSYLCVQKFVESSSVYANVL